MARARIGLALLLVASLPGLAEAKHWTYLEYGHSDVELGQRTPAHGQAAALSLELDEDWFAEGRYFLQEAEDGEPAFGLRRKEGGRVGIGIKQRNPFLRGYLLLEYARQTLDDSGNHDGRHEGGGFTVGARWLVQPWIAFEPHGGMTLYDEDRLEINTGGEVLLRAVPHLWLYAGYATYSVFTDTHGWSAGLRYQFSDPGKRRAAGARPLAQDGAPAPASTPLQAGQTLVARRALLVQDSPAFGARELGKIAPQQRLVLERTEDNEFGRWWHVSAGELKGWIRERWLVGGD